MSKRTEDAPAERHSLDPRIEIVHEAMVREADGFYRLTTTICSALLGGVVVFSERFLGASSLWVRISFIVAIVGLTLCFALLCWVRWANVEAYRDYAKALQEHDREKYESVKKAVDRGRKNTRLALWCLFTGLDRFKLPESKGTIVSQVIAATIEAGLIKLDESVGSSRKLARYLPAWA